MPGDWVGFYIAVSSVAWMINQLARGIISGQLCTIAQVDTYFGSDRIHHAILQIRFNVYAFIRHMLQKYRENRRC